MAQRPLQIDRRTQFDLFGEKINTRKAVQPSDVSDRQFVNPNPQEIYLGMVRLEDHLKQSGVKAPFIVGQLLDEQDWAVFEQRYASSGRAPYSPRRMLGLILYGLMQGISSLRGLERLARVDLGCLWVSGGICPDHAIIGRFIALHETSLSAEFFEGLTRSVLKRTGSNNNCLAGDGTVIEAACTHYRLLKEEVVKQQLEVARREAEHHPNDADKRRAFTHAQTVANILQERLNIKEAKGIKINHRSISGTEPEAVIQPLKRGRGKAPAYKPSVLANEERVVMALDIHPSNETCVLPALLDQSERITGKAPAELLLDAGYFNNQAIEETLARDISLLCPEGKQPGQPKQSNKYFLKGEFQYLLYEDAYRCKAGQRLHPTSRYRGNQTHPPYTLYSSSACITCTLRSQCTRAKRGRRIKRYHGDEAKDALREVMQHPGAKKVFKKRQWMVEPVFSHLRLSQALNRFRRRGLTAVKREFALHILAYNLSRAVAAAAAYIALWRLSQMLKRLNRTLVKRYGHFERPVVYRRKSVFLLS